MEETEEKNLQEYSKYYINSPWCHLRYEVQRKKQVILTALKRMPPLPKDACILDIGFGTGVVIYEFWKQGYEVYGCEVVKEAIDGFLGRFPNCKNSVSLQEADAVQLFYPNRTFDLVICSHVLEHIPEDKKCIQEIHRVLKNNGTAFILVPLDTNPEAEPFHFKRNYEPESFRQICTKNEFTVTKYLLYSSWYDKLINQFYALLGLLWKKKSGNYSVRLNVDPFILRIYKLLTKFLIVLNFLDKLHLIRDKEVLYVIQKAAKSRRELNE